MTQISSTTFVLAVRDLEVSRAFYVDQLGFEEDFSVVTADSHRIVFGEQTPP